MAFDKEVMETAAADAENDLNTSDEYPDEVVLPVAKWVNKWYLKAGYKRLGRILVQIAKDHEKKGS